MRRYWHSVNEERAVNKEAEKSASDLEARLELVQKCWAAHERGWNWTTGPRHAFQGWTEEETLRHAEGDLDVNEEAEWWPEHPALF